MISYKAGYKYQLTETYQVSVPIYPAEPIETKYISLSTGGLLTIRDGYAWDGPSGPTIDTKTFMRGSLGHDAICQLIRMGLLDRSWFAAANLMLRQMCLEDGMWRLRAWYVWRCVQRFGEDVALGPEKPVLTAP